MKSFFGLNDAKTADEVSELIGARQELLGQGKEPLASPQALRGPEFKGQQVVLVSGAVPVRATLDPLYAYPGYQELRANRKATFDRLPDIEDLD